ncbi:MAG: hypothetical protein ACYDAQ_21770, partial [Mycobacteriales bacterium]
MAKRGGQQGAPAGRGQQGRRERLAELQRAQAARERRTRLLLALPVVVVLGVLVGVLVVLGGNSPRKAPLTANPQLLASTSTAATGQPVDGISCSASEQVLFHIHAHLAVYVNGVDKLIPYGIGIVPPLGIQQSGGAPFVVSGKCFYWLHSHTQDGIIHIESPI